MTYGINKRRDIIESVLPCTRNHAKTHRKEVQRVHQEERVRTRSALNKFRGKTADIAEELYDEDQFDYSYNEDAEIRRLMWERRDYDNLGALLKWAPTQIKDIRLQDRVSYMYSIMPNNTIGRHAVGHIADLEEFEVPHDSLYRFRRYYKEYTPEEQAWLDAAEYAEVEKTLLKVLESPYIAKFNAEIWIDKKVEITRSEYDRAYYEWRQQRPRRYYSSLRVGADLLGGKGKNRRYFYYKKVSAKRPLKGVHDIPAFVAEVGGQYTTSYVTYERTAIIEKGLNAMPNVAEIY